MKLDGLFFYKNVKTIFISIFATFFLAQVIFQTKTEYIKPDVYVVPEVPSKLMTDVLSLGDKEFYFRVLALELQHAGDSHGRITPLKNYDYKELYKWFMLMDSLNHKSKIIPSLASYYYSQTQNPQDTIYVVRYLDERAKIDLDDNWWWLYQAIYIAKLSLKDDELALDLARKLSKNENSKAPAWTRYIHSVFLAKTGGDCEAFEIVNRILKDHESGERVIEATEMDFMRHFIKARINELQRNNFDPRKCQKKL